MTVLGRIGLVLAGALMLVGCGGLSSKTQPEQIYVLNVASGGGAGAASVAGASGAGAPGARAPGAGASVPGTLVIARPQVQPGLDTPRIALTRAGNELDYFALSRWSGSLPDVLGAFAVQSMSGSFTTVTAAGRNAGAADFELLLTVRHFEARYGDESRAPVVRVAFDCLLTGQRPRRVLGSCDAVAEEPAGDNRMSAIVAAFEHAAQSALGEVRQQAVSLATAAATDAR